MPFENCSDLESNSSLGVSIPPQATTKTLARAIFLFPFNVRNSTPIIFPFKSGRSLVAVKPVINVHEDELRKLGRISFCTLKKRIVFDGVAVGESSTTTPARAKSDLRYVMSGFGGNG